MFNLVRVNRTREITKLTLALLGGALAGAAIALMFAPKSGEETQKEVRDAWTDLTRRMRNVVDEKMKEVKQASSKVEEAAHKGKTA